VAAMPIAFLVAVVYPASVRFTVVQPDAFR
jgi:hypothetical protein